MKLFLAGTFIDQRAVLAHKPAYVLESFQYIKQWQIREIPNWKMFLLDSGAFTFLNKGKGKDKPIDWLDYLDRYVRFINEHSIENFFELDIDAIVGYDAVKAMRKRLEAATGRKCIPVWHRTRGLDEFKAMCREYDYIAIGGFAIKTIQPREYEHVKGLVRLAASYGTRVHGLGFTNKNCWKYGFYSVDSTTWSTACAYGGISYFTGDSIVQVMPPKGMMGGDNHVRRDYSIREWIKYQKYLDMKGYRYGETNRPPR